MFSAFSLYMKGCIWPQCQDHPTARIILSEREDDPGARMILPPCKRPQAARFAYYHLETKDALGDKLLNYNVHYSSNI